MAHPPSVWPPAHLSRASPLEITALPVDVQDRVTLTQKCFGRVGVIYKCKEEKVSFTFIILKKKIGMIITIMVLIFQLITGN